MSTAKEPTDEQVEAEIKLLKELKPKVARYNGFEEDNHTAIDAQIEVLQRRFDEDEVEEEYGDGKADDNVRNAAMDSCMWLQGEYEGEGGNSPAEEWKALAN